MEKSFLIVSGKGGSGKTTVALSLANGFAKLGKKVLLIETSCGLGSLDLILNDNAPVLYNLGDVLDENIKQEEAIIKTKNMEFWYICAPTDYNYVYNKESLIKFINKNKTIFDLLIIDSPAGFTDLHENISTVIDMAIFTVTPQIADVRATGKIAKIFMEHNYKNTKSVINKIPLSLDDDCGVEDLDTVIDVVGVSLLGALPLDNINCLTKPYQYQNKLKIEANALARRLLGEDIDLVLYK